MIVTITERVAKDSKHVDTINTYEPRRKVQSEIPIRIYAAKLKDLKDCSKRVL